MANPSFTKTSFDVSIQQDTLKATRSYEFNNGDTINLTVSLPRQGETSISEIHIKSIEVAISHLKTLIPQ